jgi:hypothetical protein
MNPEWPFPAANPLITGFWPTAPSHDGRDNVIWRLYLSLNVVLVEIIAKAVCNYNHNYFFLSRAGETFLTLTRNTNGCKTEPCIEVLPWFSGIRRPGMQPVGLSCV